MSEGEKPKSGTADDDDRRKHLEWYRRQFELRHAEVADKRLAQELEQVCAKRGGVLTFSEYLQVEQFGQSGHHATHEKHGATDVHKRWGETIAYLIQNGNFDQVVEFGGGDGSLALVAIKTLRQKGAKVVWNGVEINAELRKKTRERFRTEGLTDSLGILTASLEDIPSGKKTLVIFPYSLDSVPPEIFTRKSDQEGFPDALIGVTIKGDTVREVYLDSDQLKSRKMALEDGIFTFGGRKFDLKNWKLSKGQRAYLPIKAFNTLTEFAARVAPGSNFLIIDEVAEVPKFLDSQKWHLCLPREYGSVSKIYLDTFYQEAGEHLLYYPTYFVTFLQVLSSLGFDIVRRGVEEKEAMNIIGKEYHEWRKGFGFYFCYSIIAELKKPVQKEPLIKIQAPLFD